MPTIFTADAPFAANQTALVVEPSVADAVSIALTLSELGFGVIVSETFQEASSRLSMGPALLVTELKLGEYNGLHLVLRGKSAHHSLAAIVTSCIVDPTLYKEAAQLGAVYVVKTAGPREFRAAVLRTMFAEGDRSEIRPPYERRRAERRQSAKTAHEPELRVAERRAPLAGRAAKLTAPSPDRF